MAASHITEFIQSLSSEEIKVVREFINKSNTKVALGENKIKRLFEILIVEPNKKHSDNDLSNLLKSNLGAIRALKSRLFDIVQETLISSEYFENSSEFNSRERIVFNLKKKMLLARSLHRKTTQGKVKALDILLTEISVTAEKYQIYDVLIDSLIFQKYLNGLRNGINEFEKINDQIIFYDDCLRCIRYANDAYYRLIINKDVIKTYSLGQLEQHLRSSIKQMEFDYKKTNAHEINYYRHILSIALCETEKNFKRAITLCKQLLILVKENNISYNKDRVGFALSNLIHFYIFDQKYKEANKIAKITLKYYIPNSFNYLATKEQEFYSFFYDANYTAALKSISELLLYSKIDTGAFRLSKFSYYQAYTLFALKKYKEALQLLYRSLEIEKDKTRWNIGLRVLITVLFIELAKNSEASSSIATLRKYIERNGKVKEINERDILIFKLLRELEKDGFKRNEKNKTATKLLKTLADKDKPTSWNYFTPELIPLHEWVMTLPFKN